MVIVLSNENNEWNVMCNVTSEQVALYVQLLYTRGTRIFSKNKHFGRYTEHTFYVYNIRVNIQLFMSPYIFLSDVLLNYACIA